MMPWWAQEATDPPHYGIQVVPGVAPVEPITLEDAKLYLRVTVSDEDADISRLITAARLFCEHRIGHAIAQQTVDIYVDRVDPSTWIPLPVAPVASVTSVKTTDTANVQTTIDPAMYLVDLASDPARIGLPYGGTWPSSLRAFQGMVIRLVVGYTLPPEDLVQAIRVLLGHYYENRNAVESGHILTTLPLGVTDLLAPYELVQIP